MYATTALLQVIQARDCPGPPVVISLLFRSGALTGDAALGVRGWQRGSLAVVADCCAAEAGARRRFSSPRQLRKLLADTQSEVTDIRHICLRLRRFLQPQEQALGQLAAFAQTEAARETGLWSQRDASVLHQAAKTAKTQTQAVRAHARAPPA